MEQLLYRVCWRLKTTGVTGRGQAMAEHLAIAWRDHGNKTCPDCEHWVEPVSEAAQ